MKFFFRSPDLKEGALSKMGQAAMDLYRKATKQHKDALAEAAAYLEAILKHIGPVLVAESGNPWGVCQETVSKTPEGVLFHHRLFVAEQISAFEIGESSIFIDVITRQIVKESQPGEYFVGYETVGLGEFDADENDLPDVDIVRSDVIPPRMCGETV